MSNMLLFRNAIWKLISIVCFLISLVTGVNAQCPILGNDVNVSLSAIYISSSCSEETLLETDGEFAVNINGVSTQFNFENSFTGGSSTNPPIQSWYPVDFNFSCGINSYNIGQLASGTSTIPITIEIWEDDLNCGIYDSSVDNDFTSTTVNVNPSLSLNTFNIGCLYLVLKVSCQPGPTIYCSDGPQAYCYDIYENQVQAFEICPEVTDELLGVDVISGSFDPCCYSNELLVFSGPQGSGDSGTVIEGGAFGDLAGITYAALQLDDCLTFYVNADDEGTTCADGSQTPLIVQCSAIPPPKTCAFGIQSTCWENNLNNSTIIEVCPNDTLDFIKIDVISGVFLDTGDILDVYSGAAGSGAGGTAIVTGLNGDISGNIYTALNAGDCVSFNLTSDASGSCYTGEFPAFTVGCIGSRTRCTSGPQTYCYSDYENNTVAIELCPQFSNGYAFVEILSGSFHPGSPWTSGSDELSVYSGVPNSGIAGSPLAVGLTNDQTGASFYGLLPGHCVSFVINSDDLYSCDGVVDPNLGPPPSSPINALVVQCVDDADIITCSDGPQTFCFDFDTPHNIPIFEICPDSQFELLAVEFTAGFLPSGFNELDVYSGPYNSGDSGALISLNNSGDLTGNYYVAQSIGDCISFYMDSDDEDYSCADGTFEALVIQCASTPPPIKCSNGSQTACWGNNENNTSIIEVCPDSPSEILDVEILTGMFSGGDNLNVYSGNPYSGSAGILVNSGLTGDLSGSVYTSISPGHCITFSLNSDGWGSCADGAVVPLKVRCFYEPITCSDGPQTYCYGTNETNNVAMEICPDFSSDLLEIELINMYMQDCCDEISVYSGPHQSGLSGNLIAQGVTGINLNLIFSALQPGDCLSFVFNTSSSSCQSGSGIFTPITFQCYEPPAAICSDGSQTYCYDGTESNAEVFELCPDSPWDLIAVDVISGSFDACCTDMSVYSGIPGSGLNGAIIGTALSGNQAGTFYTAAAVGHCISFYINSNGQGLTCASAAGSIDPFVVSCVSPPPIATCSHGIQTACWGVNENNNPLIEICPDSQSEIIKVIGLFGLFNGSGNYTNVYSGPAGSGVSGSLIFTPSSPWQNIAGNIFTGSNPGECLTFAVTSDNVGNCQDGANVPLQVQCYSDIITCADGPQTFCYDNLEYNNIAIEICPDMALDPEPLIVEVQSGIIESCCDDMSVYSGAHNEGLLGTPIATGNSGNLAGAVYTAAATGECLSFVINSNDLNSCETSPAITPIVLECISCQDNLMLTNIIPDNIYEAETSIEANGLVLTGSTIDMHAGNEIELQTGFECEQDADLYIYIDGCE